jgi:hypothetical protein
MAEHVQTGAPDEIPLEPEAKSESAVPSLFKNRDYVLWFGGTLVSRFGTALSSIALPLLLLSKTRRPVGSKRASSSPTCSCPCPAA